MPGFFLSLRGSRRRLLRATSLALVALQGAVAMSPLVEPRTETWVGAHAEPDGARHVNPHNASTCALCSVRAQASMPASAAPEIASVQLRHVAARETHIAPARERAPTNRSRAPPLES